MENYRKIRIIGAGPAGLTAAINLAMNNYAVTVYEKNSDVGMRFNNDFQGLENWSTEDDVLNLIKTVSIKPDFFCKPFYGGLLYGPSSSAQIQSDSPFFYLIKRGKDPDTLDAALKKQALNLGIKIIFNAPMDINDGDIIATGPKRPRIIAIGVVFQTNLEDTAIVILDDTVAPKGYAYLLVSDKKATLATVLFTDFKQGNQYIEKTILKFRNLVSFEIQNPQKFAGFGNFFIQKSAVESGKLFVGEAAGFQDFLFGFGIRYAITSGYLAAKSITDGLDYNKLWKNYFGKQLRASSDNRKLYDFFGTVLYDNLIKKTGASKDPRGLWLKFYNSSLRDFFAWPKNFIMKGNI